MGVDGIGRGLRTSGEWGWAGDSDRTPDGRGEGGRN